MIRLTKGVYFALLLALLLGCTQQPKIDTPADQLAVVYATIEGVANSVALHVEVGVLSPDQATRYEASLLRAQQLADSAAIALKGEMPGNAMEALQLANRLLLELQIELQRQIDAGGAT